MVNTPGITLIKTSVVGSRRARGVRIGSFIPRKVQIKIIIMGDRLDVAARSRTVDLSSVTTKWAGATVMVRYRQGSR